MATEIPVRMSGPTVTSVKEKLCIVPKEPLRRAWYALVAEEKRSPREPDEVIMMTMPPAMMARMTEKTGRPIAEPNLRIHFRNPGAVGRRAAPPRGRVGTAIVVYPPM